MSKPVNGNHALLIGMIFSALRPLNEIIPTKVELLKDEDDDYQNQIRLTRESGSYLVTIEVESDG